nr:MAG TPA: hypothetical protein [Caudoviricetes sp.]
MHTIRNTEKPGYKYSERFERAAFFLPSNNLLNT